METIYLLAQTAGSYSSADISDGEAIALFLVFLLFGLIASLIGYVIGALLLGAIFKKAGLAAWPAWVPIYNNWKLLQIGGQQGFWAVLALIPIVNIVSFILMIIAMYHVGLKLGKPGVFVLLAFLPLIWMIWLAVDDSVWNDEAPGSAPSLATGPTRTPPVTPQVVS